MSLYSDTLDSLARESNLRTIPADRSEKPLIDLSGNDYLGIAADRQLQHDFFARLHEVPSLSASASRLLAGKQHEFNKLEQLLTDLYGAPALLFNSGYHANSGCVAALASGNCLIVADKLVHASIIDGIILSRAPFERFRHNDTAHLERILSKKAAQYDRVLIIVESIYSMDGDLAPLNEIVEIKRRFPNAELYVDEAHAFGALGRQGLGLTVDIPGVDFTLGTLGKAAGSEGAFIICRPDRSRDYLVNKARSLIFSTAIAPINCAWSRYVIERMVSMDDRRTHLAQLSQRLAGILGSANATHIQPMIVGSSEKAITLSCKLREQGFIVLPIRTPTVAAGTERLRFSLSADLPFEAIDHLDVALKTVMQNED